MKHLLIAACLGLLTACGALGSLPGIPGQIATAVNEPMGDRTLRDEQALYAVEAAYNVPAAAYVSADKRGLLPASLKASLKPKLMTLYQGVKAARAAYAIGDAEGFRAKKDAVLKLRDEVMPLIPK